MEIKYYLAPKGLGALPGPRFRKTLWFGFKSRRYFCHVHYKHIDSTCKTYVRLCTVRDVTSVHQYWSLKSILLTSGLHPLYRLFSLYTSSFAPVIITSATRGCCRATNLNMGFNRLLSFLNGCLFADVSLKVKIQANCTLKDLIPDPAC